MLAEAVTVQDAGGRMVYANTAAAQLLGCDTVEELLATPATELAARFEITDADGDPVGFEALPSTGCWPAATRRRCSPAPSTVRAAACTG